MTLTPSQGMNLLINSVTLLSLVQRAVCQHSLLITKIDDLHVVHMSFDNLLDDNRKLTYQCQ